MNFQELSKHITPTLVIDVGANVGDWYREAVRLWPDAKFKLIEANPECAHRLKEIAIQNPNTEVFSIALGRKPGVTALFIRKDASCCTGVSSYREMTDFYRDVVEIKVAVLPLDGLFTDSEFEGNTVLLKLDTQGSELEILYGASDVLADTDAVAIEVSHVAYNQGAPLEGVVTDSLAISGMRKVAELGEIVHPITREHIQSDWLYMRK